MPGQSKNKRVRRKQNAVRRRKRKDLIEEGICPLCDDRLDRIGSCCTACAELQARNARAQRFARNGQYALTTESDGRILTADGRVVATVATDPEMLEACHEAVQRIHRRRIAQVAPPWGSRYGAPFSEGPPDEP